MFEDNLLQHGFPNGGSGVDEKLIINYVKCKIKDKYMGLHYN